MCLMDMLYIYCISKLFKSNPSVLPARNSFSLPSKLTQVDYVVHNQYSTLVIKTHQHSLTAYDN